MDAPKSFHDRMSTVLDAINAACPPSKERKRPAKEHDNSDVLDEEVHSAPPTQRRCSPQHREGSRAAQRKRGHQCREQRRFMAPFKPDYAINPSKWTKYDLADDGTKGLIGSGMSTDQVNKYAAFEFLKKRQELRRESSEGNEEEEEEIGGKVIFKKPVKESVRGRRARVEEVNKRRGEEVGVGAGVCVMPEYKIGGKEEEAVKRGRRRKQLLVLGRRLDKSEKEEVMEEKGEKVRSVRENKGRQGVNLGHLEEEGGEI